MKNMERWLYLLVTTFLLLLVWAFGIRLEEHKTAFSNLQTELQEIKKVIKNDTAVDTLIRTLKYRKIDPKTLLE